MAAGKHAEPKKDTGYVSALKADSDVFAACQSRFVAAKSSQQQLLESLLATSGRSFQRIADIACGMGGLSYHLSTMFPSAQFTLVDLNATIIEEAKRALGESPRFKFIVNDLYDLSDVPDGAFDLVCCWQTLSFVENPQQALRELLRVTEKGGQIYLSSLFNLDHDVDIYANVFDRSRPSGAQGKSFCYNTFSARTVGTWLGGQAHSHRFHRHEIGIDLKHEGRGLGTSTFLLADGRRLQMSAGVAMNWAILEILK